MKARWFVRGDLDGFFGLALDNLIQLLLIVSLCRGLLGFSDDLLLGRVLPAVGLSLLVGNLFYAWQGMRLARREGRDDVCALPAVRTWAASSPWPRAASSPPCCSPRPSSA